MRKSRLLRHATHGPWGDSARHLASDAIEQALHGLSPPVDRGELSLIVSRGDDGTRETPKTVQLSREGGVPGDAWSGDAPGETDSQITMMRSDFGRLIANGQPLSLFGDNLLVDLDLSLENLPTGSRLRLGGSVLEVTPEPHTGCTKYRQRFGKDALRATADRRFRDLRLRGLYVKVIEDGAVSVGDLVEVVDRGERA